MASIIVGCSSQRKNFEDEWISMIQYDYENQIEYVFTNDKYQVIINGENIELHFSYKINGDTIIIDRGEH